MQAPIRPYRNSDADAVVSLSLAAWAPVFDSMREVLGSELFDRLHGSDWRAYQARSVRSVLDDDAMTVWVAETAAGVVGFAAAAKVDLDRRIGEIIMLAVDPAAQRHGIGTALTEHATAWLTAEGMRVAMIGTGGDPGHAAARRTYARAEYTLMPLGRYFKAL